MTVKVTAHPDPAMAGQASMPRPGAPSARFTEAPESVELTPQIRRLISNGSLVVTDETPVADDPMRYQFAAVDARRDFVENFLNKK